MRGLIDGLLGRQLYTKRRRRCVSLMQSSAVEALESRLVLFATTGNAWPNPQVITISFEPDGTNLGGVNSNLNQAFNNNPNLAGQWQTEILRAAQVWSAATNINFVVVSDNGTASGSGKNQQGDPGFGDIRIGGYNFNNSSLARAYQPPPDNNFSVAGDIVFNTGAAFGIGSGYDLFTVAVHEFGHALGLDHTSATTTAAMWSSYNGIKQNLTSDDIAGIRSIYSGGAARSVDSYDASGSNNTIATADDISSKLVKAQSSAVVSGLDITSSSDVDFYKVTAPKWADNTMTISVQSTGLSLLSPKLTVYASDKKTILGTVSGLNQHGTTISASISGVNNGDTFYIKVEGADSSVFGVGNYAVIVDMGATTTPTATSAKTTTANGTPLSGSGGAAENSGDSDEILNLEPVIETVTPDTGMSSADRTTNNNQIVLNGVGPLLSRVQILEDGVAIGSFLNLLGSWSYSVPGTLSDGHHTFTAVSTDLLGLLAFTQTRSDDFVVTVDTQAPAAPTLSVTGAGGTSGLTGTSEPGSLISIYDNGNLLDTTTTDGFGNWNYSLPAVPGGAHDYTATATDQAGNLSVASSSTNGDSNVPLHTPTVSGFSQDTGASSTDHLTNDQNLVLNGQADADALVEVFRDGVQIGTTRAAHDGSWSFDYSGTTLADGTYKFTALETNSTGTNTSGLSDPLSVTVDHTIAVPGISLVTKSTTLLLLNSLNVQGTADANSAIQVFLNGSLLGSTTADSQGNWNITYNPLLLLNGTYRFTAQATDQAGNVSAMSGSFNLVLGSTAPTVTNVSLSTSLLSPPTSTPTITGTATKATSVSIYDGNVLLGTATVGSTGKWAFTTPVLAKGKHSLTVVATDGVNVGLPSTLSIQV